MEGAQAVASPADKMSTAAVSSHEERTSHDDDYLSAGEDDDDKSDAVFSFQEDRPSAATSPMSPDEDNKSALLLHPEEAAPPAEVLVQPSKHDPGESSFEDRAYSAELQDDHHESSASPAEVRDDHHESSASSAEVQDDHNQSSPSSAEVQDDRHESSASPAVAQMPSENETGSASEASIAKESNSSSNTESNSDHLVSVSRATEDPPIDNRAMVPENGGDNHYGLSSLAKSKSFAVGHTVEEGREKHEKSEMKIIARPSAEDDFTSSPLHRRSVSLDLVAKVPANYTPTPDLKPTDSIHKFNNVQIDTAAPIESVKAAVSKFGGIVDWKAHRVHTVEKRKFIEQELDKAQEELPAFKQQYEAANDARIRVLKKLESTKRLIEELKLNLDRAQTEEQQAKQDAELAKLRVEEMEQGIADEASFAAKAQLEIAKARHAGAVSELKSVNDELEQLRRDYDVLISEKEAAETKAEEAMFSSKEIEKSVQSLTIELITLKQSLDSAHSAHLEAEENRIGAVMAKELDSLNWEMELKQAEEELEKLNEQMITTKDLKQKLDEATSLLQDLKGELASYMESKSDGANLDDPLKDPEKKTRADIEAAITAAKRDLQEVKSKIEKATKEVNILKVASASLRSQLEKESSELQAIQQREGMASIAAASLEAELNRIKSEIAVMQMKEKEEREKLVDLPLQLQKAGEEAEQAKELARLASEDFAKAKQEADEAKEAVSERESKLREVEKEIEAAKASERLAVAAINALKENESSQKNVDDESFIITLSLEEYYELSKRAHEAEEQANERAAEVLSQIEIAKEAEKKSMDKLEEVSNELSQQKESLEAALQKAAQAEEKKLSVEQELRNWRADHEEKRKNAESAPSSTNAGDTSKDDSKNQNSAKSSKEEVKVVKKKKKSFFPRFFMFLGRSKKSSHSSKQEGS